MSSVLEIWGRRVEAAAAICAAMVLAGCGSNSPVIPRAQAGGAGSGQSVLSPAEGELLGSLNTLFRDVYSLERDELAAAAPLILVDFGTVRLFRDGQELGSVRVAGERFHVLKVFAHLPLGVYLALDREDEQLRRTYAARVHDGVAQLGATPLTPEQRERCSRLAEESLQILEHGTVADLEPFAAVVAPLMRQNAYDAAELFVRAIHSAVSSWRAQLAGEWEGLRVVIRGPHQARRLHAATQYFAAMFGSCGDGLSFPGESPRVIYAEWSPRGPAQRLAGVVAVDAAASQLFFGDPEVLSTDVLADGAAAAVTSLGMGPSLPCDD
ncbi:MAG: hypothetical protein SangKO_011760 [Sandaracinaceae bacterium]